MNKTAGKQKGLRCRICTGCGLCPGIGRPGRVRAVYGKEEEGEPRNLPGTGVLHVLAEDALLGERLPLRGRGKRLVTADIGTTTIAMLLYNEDGSVADRWVSANPQIRYGRDVLSRIREAQNPETALKMKTQVREVLEKGIRRFARSLAAGERMLMVLAANTTMTYLFMGWDTEELGRAPFRAGRLETAYAEVGGISCFVFPGISAFVGGDIAAGIHACRMAEREDITLLIDLGTNGEMVLGNSKRRIACATAAGPAFEGGAGAGIWGADMVSLLARLLEEGILDHTGLLASEYFEDGIRIGNVLVTQEAVRSIQLAKGAVAAGIEILLDKYSVGAEQVNRVVLAGGFGYYLDPGQGARIGLLPPTLAEKAVTGGNIVLSGALLAGRQLFSEAGESTGAELEKICRNTEVINLAMEEEFQERYLRAMNFPG